VHLVGSIIKKFVTMHGHMNVKFYNISSVIKSGIVIYSAVLLSFPTDSF